MKKVMNESELKALISESLKNTLNEMFDTDYDGFNLGVASGLANRAAKSPKAMFDKNYRNRKKRQEKFFGDEGKRTNSSLNSHLGGEYNSFENGKEWGKSGKMPGLKDKNGRFSPFQQGPDERSREDFRKEAFDSHNGYNRQDVNRMSNDEYDEMVRKPSNDAWLEKRREQLKNYWKQEISEMSDFEYEALVYAIKSAKR